jgi:hypothetical protein
MPLDFVHILASTILVVKVCGQGKVSNRPASLSETQLNIVAKATYQFDLIQISRQDITSCIHTLFAGALALATLVR